MKTKHYTVDKYLSATLLPLIIVGLLMVLTGKFFGSQGEIVVVVLPFVGAATVVILFIKTSVDLTYGYRKKLFKRGHHQR